MKKQYKERVEYYKQLLMIEKEFTKVCHICDIDTYVTKAGKFFTQIRHQGKNYWFKHNNVLLDKTTHMIWVRNSELKKKGI